jgi:hypothetical protein
MTEVVGSDIPQGPEVKWYAGGVLMHETSTGATGATGYTYASGATGEYGSAVVLVNGVGVTHKEVTPGTDAGGATAVTFSALAAASTLEVYFVKTSGTGNSLIHVASCQDVKCDASATTKSAAVHGQATKLNSVGAIENTADLEELYYNGDLVNLAMGNYFADVPATGGYKWTNKFNGSKKIGALVGKRTNSAGTVTYKWFLIGAQTTGVSASFPTEDMYKRSVKFLVDFWVEVDLVA